jgi:hypothetical protein
MRSISVSVAAIALIASLVPTDAQQRSYPEGGAPGPKAVGDPLQLIYRVSGLRDSGSGPEAGIATAFHCTSFSSVDETLHINVRNFNATVRGVEVTVASRRTATISTHLTRIFTEDAVVGAGITVNQGSAEILATSTNMVCSAMIVDAGANFPEGIALHMVRFNAQSGSQE